MTTRLEQGILNTSLKLNYVKVASNELNQQNRFEETLQYGVRPGGENVRKEVANFLSRQYESPVQWLVLRF